ncbi:hypothetical protein RIF29_35317 [Crotalaria pallida]|uniref:Uncharacterized protein n=1 Tax=Crotalaria pallida TaxID=3830 RepID=A0AAN9EC24_CROPI
MPSLTLTQSLTLLMDTHVTHTQHNLILTLTVSHPQSLTTSHSTLIPLLSSLLSSPFFLEGHRRQISTP